MMEVNGVASPGKGEGNEALGRRPGTSAAAKGGWGGWGGGDTAPLRRARLVCSCLIPRHEVTEGRIVVVSLLDEISVNYFEIRSLASFHSFQVKIQTFAVVAWSFLSRNKAPNCSDITIQKQVLWQTSFVNLLQRLIDYFSFFN